MSLFNTMRTATSGMAAQSNALSTIGDNIANSGTTGYKAATAEFETALGVNTTGEYESGGVQTDVRYSLSKAGPYATSSSATDLAINGNGFFVVSKGGDGQYLTRAGSFVPDKSGNFVNAAGYELMGYPMTPSGPGTSLSVINIPQSGVSAKLTSSATLDVNLPATATAVPTTSDLPSDNKADSTYTLKSSALTVYDSLGKSTVVDMYYTKTDDNTWQATAYDQGAASSGGGFPYSSAALGTSTLTFDPTTGALASTDPVTTPPGAMDIKLSPTATAIPVSFGSTTQLATGFSVNQATADGYAASKLSSVSISKDGTVTAIYGSGAQIPVYQIPLGTVTSPSNLTPLNGNVYQATSDSGPVTTSIADSGATGQILSGQLENSNVDLATELTNMIVAQRSYQANTKVLQTGSDLLGELNRITVN